MSRAGSADAIVVAAGSSRRMAGIDKLLAPIAGRPLLARTLDALAAAPSIRRIVVVAPPERLAALEDAGALPSAVVAGVAGGDRRQDSVAAGVAALEAQPEGLPDERVVLVHDGARPNVPSDLVGRVVDAVLRHGAAVPVLPVAETIKRVAGGRVVETIDRAGVGTAQTPQGVRAELLRAAYRRFPPAGPETWTDEAALLEACRIPVHVVPGDSANLKVTTPADLVRAEAAIGDAAMVRTGLGVDAHPFGPGEPLVLGGIELAGLPRLHGHSDGDVVLHAIADALLGAAALGDLGRLFPAGPETPRGIASAHLLASAVDRVRDAGWRVSAADVTIVAGRPRLGPTLDTIRDHLARLLHVDAGAVSVKASSGNLLGLEGSGRGISASAIVTIRPAVGGPVRLPHRRAAGPR